MSEQSFDKKNGAAPVVEAKIVVGLPNVDLMGVTEMMAAQRDLRTRFVEEAVKRITGDSDVNLGTGTAGLFKAGKILT